MRYTLPKNCLEALHADDYDTYRHWHCAFCGKNRGGIYTTRLYYERDGLMHARMFRGCERCCKEYAHETVNWDDLKVITINMPSKWERDKRLFKRA